MKRGVLLSLLIFIFVIQGQAASKPTVAEAEQFMKQAEARLNDIEVKAAEASWVQENFITDDTQALSADAQDQLTAATTELIELSSVAYCALELIATANHPTVNETKSVSSTKRRVRRVAILTGERPDPPA